MNVRLFKPMQVIHSNCAGLDVHKATVVACAIVTGPDHQITKQMQRFGTTSGELLQLSDWLKSLGVVHVAMESTGVYWVPVYNILEGSFELLVANAQHVKNVPGRKTDVKDSEWLADLHRHGLLRGSFIPPQGQRELRELVRHRSNLVDRRAQVVNELHKCLESTNLKLGNVVANITGVSALDMLRQMLAGETDPERLAELARGKLQKKKEALRAALEGQMRSHHRFILSQLLAEIAWCEEQIEEASAEIEQRLSDQAELIERLDEIPGVNRRIAEIVLAEIGTSVERFPSDRHLVSWAGLCPGNNESAGKRRSSHILPGNRSLRRALVEAAQAAARKKGSYLQALYRRLASPRGRPKALIAVARTILQTIYFMMARGTRYTDLGGLYFDQRKAATLVRRLSKRIEQLGFQVSVQPTAQPA